MKEMQFTTRELELLVWALNNQVHETFALNRKSGKVPAKDERVELLSNMCGKAYQLMIQAHKEKA